MNFNRLMNFCFCQCYWMVEGIYAFADFVKNLYNLYRLTISLLIIFHNLCSASNIPVVKEVEAIMSPAAFTVVRFAISAIPFIPFVLRARGDADTRNAGIELGFWVSLGYLMQAFGLLTSDAGRASFITTFTV